MNIFSLSTSTPVGSIAVHSEDKVFSRSFKKSGQGFSQCLGKQTRDLFNESALDKNNLDALIVDCGPGSFTGIRVGVAYINGLALGLGVKVYSFYSLDFIAGTYLKNQDIDNKQTIHVGLNAARGEVYYSKYSLDNRIIERSTSVPSLMKLEHFLGSELSGIKLGFQINNSSVIEVFPDVSAAKDLLNRLKPQVSATTAALPEYVRLSDAMINLKQKETSKK